MLASSREPVDEAVAEAGPGADFADARAGPVGGEVVGEVAPFLGAAARRLDRRCGPGRMSRSSWLWSAASRSRAARCAVRHLSPGRRSAKAARVACAAAARLRAAWICSVMRLSTEARIFSASSGSRVRHGVSSVVSQMRQWSYPRAADSAFMGVAAIGARRNGPAACPPPKEGRGTGHRVQLTLLPSSHCSNSSYLRIPLRLSSRQDSSGELYYRRVGQLRDSSAGRAFRIRVRPARWSMP